MSNEKPVELTEAEREALFKAGDHHPDHCDCTAFADEVGYAPGSEICDALADTYDVVARIKAAARREALLEAAEESEMRINLANRVTSLEATVARVEALAKAMDEVPDYTASDYDRGRVDQRLANALELWAALAKPERDEEG